VRTTTTYSSSALSTHTMKVKPAGGVSGAGGDHIAVAGCARSRSSGFVALPGLRTHVGPRRYLLECLAAITVFARLGTESRLALVATAPRVVCASRNVTIRPRSSS
jgi:hypothetical protein